MALGQSRESFCSLCRRARMASSALVEPENHEESDIRSGLAPKMMQRKCSVQVCWVVCTHSYQNFPYYYVHESKCINVC